MKTKKNKRSSLTKTKKANTLRKISIPIDFTKKDKGYDTLLNKKLIDFVFKSIKEGHNLIQTQDYKPFYLNKPTILHLQSKKVSKWKLYEDWSDIQCKEFNDFIKTSPCKTGKKRSKIFYKLKSNPHIGGFTTYLVSLHLNAVTKQEHLTFVSALRQTFKSKPVYIHNEDLDWLHLKEYKKELL